MKTKKLVEELFGTNQVWANFEPWPTKMIRYNDWRHHFKTVIETCKPEIIMEIGSWYGYSALSMAGIVKSLGLDCTIVCIDTWLGNIEHWRDNLRPGLLLKNGYPQVFYQFLSNVKNAGHDDIIFPIPLPSLIAMRWLKDQGVVIDMAYVDGSHGEHDVYWDLKNAYDLLRAGGILCGDDFTWGTVRAAVMKFSEEIGNPMAVRTKETDPRNTNGNFWSIMKK